ncbi:MAG: ATP-binding protein [bacterium]|nr:ATP-binding protein [bacterium]
MSMKNIAGQPVREQDFFYRPMLVSQFKQRIKVGSSVLIAAPRRVGKTSLMLYLLDTGMEDFCFIYLITESVNNENEYFKRILHQILDTEFFTSLQRISNKTVRILKDRLERINEIGSSVKFDKETSLDYREEFIETVKSMDLEGRKIVFMIDEFSQTLENIIDDEGKSSAVHFLQSNRELRQDPEINGKVQFVYAGSIGLENIVNRLNSLNLVNDLVPVRVPPLDEKEAHALMQALVENAPFTLSKANREDILKRIQWYIPFYIQLAVLEIGNHFPGPEPGTDARKKRVTSTIIDDAFARMLEHRNSFEHWHTRIRKAFKKDEYNFAKGVLNLTAEKEFIDKKEILNIAQKFNTMNSYNDIVNALVYDGYINNNDEPGVFRFNSPLLKLWWWKNVAY